MLYASNTSFSDLARGAEVIAAAHGFAVPLGNSADNPLGRRAISACSRSSGSAAC